MKKVNLPNGRRVYAEEAMAWQENAEQAIMNHLPEFNERVVTGLEVSLETIEVTADIKKTKISISAGIGISPKGYRSVLLESEEYIIEDLEIPEEAKNANRLNVYLLPIKEPEGEWLDKNNEKHARNYVDSGYIVIAWQVQTGAMGDFGPTADWTYHVVRGQEYLGEVFGGSYKEQDLLRLGSFTKPTEDADWQWEIGHFIGNEIIPSLFRKQALGHPGDLHFMDYVPGQSIQALINWIEGEPGLRWRYANGQELPANSTLRRYGKTHVPDYDNGFLRIWGKSSGDRPIGDRQLDAMQEWSADVYLMESGGPSGGVARVSHVSGSAILLNERNLIPVGGSTGTKKGAQGFRISPNVRKSEETRPINTLCLVFYLT